MPIGAPVNVLIVGGGSFIGAHLAARLLSAGCQVTAFDRSLAGNALNYVLSPRERQAVHQVSGDVLDFVALSEAVVRSGARVIVHLAAALIPECRQAPAWGVRVNCDGLNNSFEAARIFGLERVVWASSDAVYGPQRRYGSMPPDEDAPRFPDSIYGACKALNEDLGAHYFSEHGVDNIGLRFRLVYGPGRMRGAWSYELGRELIEKPAHGEASCVRFADTVACWQHVSDAARAIEAALRHEGATEARHFNTGGDIRRVAEAVQIVRHLLPGANIALEEGEADDIVSLNCSRAERELGLTTYLSLEEGLARSLDFYRQRPLRPGV